MYSEVENSNDDYWSEKGSQINNCAVWFYFKNFEVAIFKAKVKVVWNKVTISFKFYLEITERIEIYSESCNNFFNIFWNEGSCDK